MIYNVSTASHELSIVADIINEAKMANAIVQEVLDFVRPMRLQVERTSIADAVQGAIQLADTKARRGGVQVEVTLEEGLPLIQGDQHQLMQLFTNLLINAYEALEGRGRVEGADAGVGVGAAQGGAPHHPLQVQVRGERELALGLGRGVGPQDALAQARGPALAGEGAGQARCGHGRAPP